MRNTQKLCCLAAASLSTSFALNAQEVLEMATFEVTAQRRVQPIQDVPISVTAYSGDFLEKAGIRQYKDLAPFVPGLFIQEQSPNNPGINIRGVTTDSGDPRSETRVSIFQDGVSISRSRASVVELFDMERVEVLKGPQGTLFGRGAEIGAVSLVQNKAQNMTAGELTVGGGDYSDREASGFVNAPLLKDSVYGRVAFSYSKHDGFVDNVADGSKLNGKNTKAGRVSLRWAPDSETTFDLIANYQHDNPPGTAFKSGSIAPTGGDTSPYTFAELNRGRDLYIDRSVWGVTGILNHEFTKSVSLTSTTGWRKYDSMEQFDADGSYLNLLEFAEDARGSQFSQDLRVNFSAGSGFTGFVGAGYFNESGTQRVPFYGEERYIWPFLSGQFKSSLISQGVPAALVNAAVPTLNPLVPQNTLPASFALFATPGLPASLQALSALANAPLNGVNPEEYINSGKTEAYDLFADGSYKVTDRLELSLGLRLTREKDTSGYQVNNAATASHIGFLTGGTPNLVFAPTNGLRETSLRQTGWVGRAVAQYKILQNLNAYANVAKGRRPESVVVDASSTTQLSQETVWNYEAGLKGSFLAGRLQWNTAVFRYDYAHFQTSVADPNNLGRFITQDAGNATGTGFEFAVQGSLTRNVSVFGSYGYTDATFDDTDSNGQRQRYAGYSFRLTARHTASLGTTLSLPFSGAGRFYVTPMLQYKSRHYFDDDNSLFDYSLSQGGFTLFNLRAGWVSEDTKWEVSLHAENLGDKEYLIDAGNTGGSFGIPTFIRGNPRNWGVSLTRRF